MQVRQLPFSEYSIGWICALPEELAASLLLLDERHNPSPTPFQDNSNYRFGRISQHNVVLACLPVTRTGTNAAASVARDMLRTFPVNLLFLVGVAGGIPSADRDIRLGDVVLAWPQLDHGGVVQYDFGKVLANGSFQMTRQLNRPNARVLNILTSIAALEETGDIDIDRHVQTVIKKNSRFAIPHKASHPDILFEADTPHVSSNGPTTCAQCDRTRIVERPNRHPGRVHIHRGTILSGNALMRDATQRDNYSRLFPDAACFEMESSGLYEESFCIVVRGISDYADEHKGKSWQRYAALTAAAYAKEIILNTNPSVSKFDASQQDLISSVADFEDNRQRSWSVLYDLPRKIFAANQYFFSATSDNKISEFGQELVHKRPNQLLETHEASRAVQTICDESSSLPQIPLSVALERVDSSTMGSDIGSSLSAQDDAVIRDYLALQSQAFAVLRSAMMGYVRRSSAYSYMCLMLKLMQNIPSSVPLLSADKIFFIDANNGLHTLPLEYFRGWDTFNSMIQNRFEGHPGFEKIKNRQYLISVAGIPNSVLNDRSWRGVKPGMRITMDIVFNSLVLDGGQCLLCGQNLYLEGESFWKCRECTVTFSAKKIARHEADALSLRIQQEEASSSLQPGSTGRNWSELYTANYESGELMEYRHSRVIDIESPRQVLEDLRPVDKGGSAEDEREGLDDGEDPAGSTIVTESVEAMEDRLQVLAGERGSSLGEVNEDLSALSLFKRAQVSSKSTLYHALLSGKVSAIIEALSATSSKDVHHFERVLLAAVLVGDQIQIKWLLDRGADPLYDIEPLGTPLRSAALHDKTQILYNLLLTASRQSRQNSVQLKAFRSVSIDALIAATLYNRIKSVEVLLSFGVNPFESPNPGKPTALLHAIRLRRTKVLRLIFDKAAKLGLLTAEEEDLLVLYTDTFRPSGLLMGNTWLEQYRTSLLEDIRDGALAHCVSEVIQGRGRILQNWITARLKTKPEYQKIPGASEFERYFTTGLEEEDEDDLKVADGSPKIVIDRVESA